MEHSELRTLCSSGSPCNCSRRHTDTVMLEKRTERITSRVSRFSGASSASESLLLSGVGVGPSSSPLVSVMVGKVVVTREADGLRTRLVVKAICDRLSVAD